MLSYYACLSGAEKAAMEMAGQVSEETLQILAQALNDEDMAYVPVRDADIQTQPEHAVVPHNLQSLLDATQSLHQQRIAHEKQWYISGQYQSTVEKTTICEVAKDGRWLDNDERQDVTMPCAALHEPAGNEMDKSRIAYCPLILLGTHNRYLIKDSGAEDMKFLPMAELHQLCYQQSAIKLNDGIARIDTRSGEMLDAEGQPLGVPKPEHLVSGQCYSATVPPCNCDEGVLDLAPRCNCPGMPKCTAAQVWVLVDGTPGEGPELRRAANAWQCGRWKCGFRQEMPPTIYWFWNAASTAELRTRGGCMIHYLLMRKLWKRIEACTNRTRSIHSQQLRTVAEHRKVAATQVTSITEVSVCRRQSRTTRFQQYMRRLLGVLAR